MLERFGHVRAPYFRLQGAKAGARHTVSVELQLPLEIELVRRPRRSASALPHVLLLSRLKRIVVLHGRDIGGQVTKGEEVHLGRQLNQAISDPGSFQKSKCVVAAGLIRSLEDLTNHFVSRDLDVKWVGSVCHTSKADTEDTTGCSRIHPEHP